MPRVTPEDDPERLAERLRTFSNGKIEDEPSFNKAWLDYMGNDLTTKQRNALQPKVRKAYANRFDVELKKRRIPKAERRERERAPGFVGAPSRTTVFDIPGTQKGRSTFCRRIITKAGARNIDALGRYVSVKK